MDDRVCMHYVVDRLESIIELHDPQKRNLRHEVYAQRVRRI